MCLGRGLPCQGVAKGGRNFKNAQQVLNLAYSMGHPAATYALGQVGGPMGGPVGGPTYRCSCCSARPMLLHTCVL